MTATSTATDPALAPVRAAVRKVLLRTPAFRTLPKAQQRSLAHDMVKVAGFIVDGGGETAGVPMSAIVSTGLADPPPPPDRAADARKVGELGDLKKTDAAAAKAGGQAYVDIINRVDFPAFVGGLVEGTFNAIVNSSIKQMEAYSSLVENIAKSVDEYMRDNITPNQARDYLAGRYPDHLQVDTARGDPKLVPVGRGRDARGGRGGGDARGGRDVRGGRDAPGGRPGGGARGGLAQSLAAEQSPLPDFMKDLGLSMPVNQLDAKTAEETLVPAARRRIAMDRQQLLATMVLMGINRLIVTDGRISASCVFELDTTDAISQYAETASDYDETTRKKSKGWGFWFMPSEVQRSTSDFHISTFNSTESESRAEIRAKLAGNVDINFRSETFPLERMADLLQIQEIEAKAPVAATPAATPALPPMQLPPPPALPPLPGLPGQTTTQPRP
jgi:hypothetical protein